MKLPIFKQKRITYILLAIAVILTISLFVIDFALNNNNSVKSNEEIEAANKEPFEKTLKIEGEFVSTELFAREGEKFFKLNKYNSEVSRMTDEERNDLFFDKVIERVVLEKFIEKDSKVKITDAEIDEYMEKNVKAQIPDGSFEYYLEENGFQNEDDLKKEIKFFLYRVAYLPAVAKEKGLELSEEELKRTESGKITEDELLMNKFLSSDEFKSWIEEVKKGMKIEIFAPSILAYRYYKEKDYKNAAKYYEEAYNKYDSEIYLDKANECKEKF